MKMIKTNFNLSMGLLLLAMTSQALASNGGSIEFMCKTKAKEIAAETYKGCVLENKQAQVERIRKEYQSKLAELKSQYNNELKQLSPQKNNNKSLSTTESSEAPEMKAKKLKTTHVKKEKIDFSSASQSSAPDMTSALDHNDPDGDSSKVETEIVEIPVQQE